MISVTIAGRIGKDAETRTTQSGDPVTGWSVAADTGFGDRKVTTWFDCSLWGERGRKLAPYLTKGSAVTVIGELGQREHNGKIYLTVRVSDVAMQGGGKQSDTPGFHDKRHVAGYDAQRPAGGGGGFDDGDSIPF